MSIQRFLHLVGALALTVLMVSGVAVAQDAEPQSPRDDTDVLGTAFTYQGQLKKGGSPVEGTCEMAFRLHDAAEGGAQAGSAITHTVPVTDGLFTEILDFGSSAFTGDARWLGISVKCAGDTDYADLGRQALTAAPYALYATRAPWSGLAGVPEGFADGVDDVTAVVSGTYIYAGDGLTQASSGDAVTLSLASTYRLPQTCNDGQIAEWNDTANEWQCGTDDVGAGGSYWSLTGDAGTTPGTHFLGTTDNQALELHVNGDRALRLEPHATSPNLIGGYSGNSVTAGVYGATIGGGGESGALNRVTDDYGTVSGGQQNRAGDDDANTSDIPYATVGGGYDNTASNDNATVAGGYSNTASGYVAAVGGGRENQATHSYTTVSGGYNNSAAQNYAVVGGGSANSAGDDYATVGGGWNNAVNGYAATASGGRDNTITSNYATVGGGEDNVVNGTSGTVGGGEDNTISTFGGHATIGGGYSNEANYYYATVPGGRDNTAAGRYSLAAGRRAKANHDGTFVWADSADTDFASTGTDQFLVRATGGVTMVVGGSHLGIVSDPSSTGAPFSVDGAGVTVISGTNASAAMLDVTNDGGGSAVHGVAGAGSTFSSPGYYAGVWGDSSNGYGVVGSSNGAYSGVYGVNNSTAINSSGVYGRSTTSAGATTNGVMGQSDATIGRGVYGRSSAEFGYGVYAENTHASGVALMAAGSGVIKSTADITVAVSPLKMVGTVNANVEIRPYLGGYVEVRPGSVSNHNVLVPVDLPTVLFGTPAKLKSVQVCYRCDVATSFIGYTRVRYVNGSGNYVDLITSPNDHTSTTWDCYTLTDGSPDEIEGSLYINLELATGGTGEDYDVRVGKITLTLTEQ